MENEEKMNNNFKESSYIFITKDPLGREVRLKAETFYFHITGGHHERKEFIGEEETIERVISDPKYILLDNPNEKSNTREKYIDIVDLEKMNSLKNLVVIVDHSSTEYGDIVTVIAKDRLKSESTKGGAVYVRPKSTRTE